MNSQHQKNVEENRTLIGRIKELTDKALTDSEGYHKRVKEFKSKISKLESEIGDKQNLIVNHNKHAELK
jgi:hypothetical protein